MLYLDIKNTLAFNAVNHRAIFAVLVTPGGSWFPGERCRCTSKNFFEVVLRCGNSFGEIALLYICSADFFKASRLAPL